VERLGLKNLAVLPPGIGRFSQLRELDLTGSRLASLPAQLGRLQKLEVLNLTGNQLKEFPRLLLGLPKLHTLILTGNGLTALPEELARMASLRSLHLVDNQLTSLPQALLQSTTLTDLQVRGNPIPGLLLSKSELAATPTFSSLAEASKQPDKVYKLELQPAAQPPDFAARRVGPAFAPEDAQRRFQRPGNLAQRTG
jgi:Leucine-rich repeat (LRR) protein